MDALSFCRFCADIKPLEKMFILEGNINLKNEIQQKVSCFASFVNLCDHDVYPTSICYVCKVYLDQAFIFFEKVKKAQYIVKSLLANQDDDCVELPDDTLVMQEPYELTSLPHNEFSNENIKVEDAVKEASGKAFHSIDSLSNKEENNSSGLVVERNAETVVIKDEDHDETSKTPESFTPECKLWTCPYCSLQFNYLTSFKIHAKSVHNTYTVFKCVECSTDSAASLFDYEGFRKHMENYCNSSSSLKKGNISSSTKTPLAGNSKVRRRPMPTHVKKPLNAFMMFMKDMRPKLLADDVNATLKHSSAINIILGQKWNQLTSADRDKYYEMARREKQKHKQLYPDFVQTFKVKRRKPEKEIAVVDTSWKKCRAHYGRHQQHLWCRGCRRKKKCIRNKDSKNTPESIPDSIATPETPCYEEHVKLEELSDDDGSEDKPLISDSVQEELNLQSLLTSASESPVNTSQNLVETKSCNVHSSELHQSES